MEVADQQAQKQLQLQKQMQLKKQQLEKQKMQLKQQGKLPVNTESIDTKLSKIIAEKVATLSERADFWHPDPEKDRKLGGPGANQRAREDRAVASKPKDDPKKLRPGESYMEYAKRQQRKESYVPGKPAEKLGAVTAIPQSEREAAKQRLLAKAKAKREAMQKEELTTEGKVAWDDKKNPNPSGYTPKEKSEAKRKQLGVDDPNKASFEKGGPGEKEYARHGNLSAAQEKMKKRGEQPKGKPHQYKKDPFWKKTKGQVKRTMFGTDVPKDKKSSYPSSVATKKEETEMITFSQFMEARRMDKEGVDRGDSRRAERAERAKASLAAKAKRDKAIDKYEKSSGRTVDRSKSVEYKAHAKNHPGSRQAPKVKGEKETALQTHNRRVNRQVSRVVKHGHTAKEKAANRGIYSSRFD